MCETEFKGADLIPRAIVASGLVAGLWGFGVWLQSLPPTEVVKPRKIAGRSDAALPVKAEGTRAPSGKEIVASQASNNVADRPEPQRPVAPSAAAIQPASRPRAEEPVYYCGAETKKGTACSRRVKGNVRCFQHTGMPVLADTGGDSTK